MGKIISTLITVVIAVGASGALWIGANLLFNQARGHWRRFATLALGATGFFVGMLLSGNRALRGTVSPDDAGFIEDLGRWIWFPLLAGAACAVVGALLSSTQDRTMRLAIGVGGLGGVGVLAGALMRPEVRPDFEIVPIVVWPLIGVAVAVGIAMLRKHDPVPAGVTGAAIGTLVGSWGIPDLGGGGSATWAIVAAAIPAALVGARLGMTPIPDLRERGLIDQASRKYIFLGPALLFIFASLVVPAIRTLILSFKDRSSVEWVGFSNYVDTFQDKDSFDASGWTNLFGSQLFWIAVALGVVFVVLGARQKSQTGRVTELGSPSSFPLLGAFLFFCFALFTALRGTLINNLWWVVVVVVFSTGLGLAVAVLADNVKGEKLAKSIIFMPMAISLVGASIIWRFMYQPRDTSVDQTGVMNAIWVGLGRLSTGDGPATLIVGLVAIALLVVLVAVVARFLVRREFGRATVPGIAAVLVAWFTLRYWSDSAIGGATLQEDGSYTYRAVGFIQEPPFNNFWLMIVLVWIQTGFAMVILSAAIKAVPDELIEAARVDGANDTQIFWRVTLPQIATTIGVVVTTLIVLVMKVFDIVKVMTNGQFGTQVLANDMFSTAFNNFDTGRGAALAILILVSVLPVMIFNIREMQKEEG